ncbi:MAG: hypothetical protein ACK5PR_01970, partial [bacterium]
MKSLLFEKYLLEKMRALAGSKLTGVFTHIPAGTPYPYGLLSVGEVKGLVGEPFMPLLEAQGNEVSLPEGLQEGQKGYLSYRP